MCKCMQLCDTDKPQCPSDHQCLGNAENFPDSFPRDTSFFSFPTTTEKY